MSEKKKNDKTKPTIQAAQETAILSAINKVFTQRLRCRDEEELGKTCLTIAEELTGARFGFIGELNAMGRFDTYAITNPGWDACNVAGSNVTMLITDMELRGIWAEPFKSGKSVIANQPSKHPSAVGVPEGHPELISILAVPMKHDGKTIGVISLGNKKGGFTDSDRIAIESLSVAIVEAMRSKRAEDKISQQAQEILEISTPVLKIWDGVVVAPLIGMLDSMRTSKFMDELLNTVVKTNSPMALVDITGVPTIDTQTAQHLIEAITAIRLLGAQVVLTGVKPGIAQTLVHLGIDLSDINTQASLSEGLKVAFDKLNLEVVRKNLSEGGI